MKKFYSEPKAQIIEVSYADIIATSTGDGLPGSGEQPGFNPEEGE